jgi:hypothetical protein
VSATLLSLDVIGRPPWRFRPLAKRRAPGGRERQRGLSQRPYETPRIYYGSVLALWVEQDQLRKSLTPIAPLVTSPASKKKHRYEQRDYDGIEGKCDEGMTRHDSAGQGRLDGDI